MIVEVRAKNCFIFEEEIIFSLKADMRNKRLSSNVHMENGFNVLKTTAIYGQNNAGKTCLLKCIRSIKQILLNQRHILVPNLFTKDPICNLGITFLWKAKEYSYDFQYHYEANEFIYERFVEIQRDIYGNEKEVVWIEKDCNENIYKSMDEKLIDMMSIVSKNNLLCYLIDTKNFIKLNELKCIIQGFAQNIDIINMNNIPIQHTIELMKNKNHIQEKIVDFIKNADLYLDNYEYVDMENIEVFSEEEKPEEKIFELPDVMMDQIRLVSTYRGVKVPSTIFDSTGTKKIAAIAGYVIEALEKGRILIVDELDSSIHFKLTRAIVSLFNNELNNNAQMIFTVHDINLLDCKRMFRKEQIWFVHKDREGVYVYSLSDFTAQQGVRDTTDIIEKYRKGALGALPEPELINTLLSIKGNKNGK